jgi:hypothetical protein
LPGPPRIERDHRVGLQLGGNDVGDETDVPATEPASNHSGHIGRLPPVPPGRGDHVLQIAGQGSLGEGPPAVQVWSPDQSLDRGREKRPVADLESLKRRRHQRGDLLFRRPRIGRRTLAESVAVTLWRPVMPRLGRLARSPLLTALLAHVPTLARPGRRPGHLWISLKCLWIDLFHLLTGGLHQQTERCFRLGQERAWSCG